MNKKSKLDYKNEIQIVATLSAQLSWSHFIDILPLKTEEDRNYYVNEVAKRNLSVKKLRHQISCKAFERKEIANTQLGEATTLPFNVFRIIFTRIWI